jgi:hypothetical protein
MNTHAERPSLDDQFQRTTQYKGPSKLTPGLAPGE